MELLYDILNELYLISGMREHNNPLAVEGRFWGNVGKLRAGNEREDARGERKAYGLKWLLLIFHLDEQTVPPLT